MFHKAPLPLVLYIPFPLFHFLIFCPSLLSVKKGSEEVQTILKLCVQTDAKIEGATAAQGRARLRSSAGRCGNSAQHWGGVTRVAMHCVHTVRTASSSDAHLTRGHCSAGSWSRTCVIVTPKFGANLWSVILSGLTFFGKNSPRSQILINTLSINHHSLYQTETCFIKLSKAGYIWFPALKVEFNWQ